MSHKKIFLFGIVGIPSIPQFSFQNRNANVCIGIPIDFVIFILNQNFGIAGSVLYLLLHKSVKTFPSTLAKMVAGFVKLDTIPRLFLKILKKKIDEFTNKLSFVTPKKSKREAMSEVHSLR